MRENAPTPPGVSETDAGRLIGEWGFGGKWARDYFGAPFRSTSLIRPCQPSPVALNASMTALSRRMLISCFVGAFCAELTA